MPDATFNVFSHYPEEYRSRVADPSVHVYSLTRAAVVLRLIPLSAVLAVFVRLGLGFVARLFPADVRALAESRVQVDLAGVSFLESRRRDLAANALTLLPAFLLRVPVAKGAEALGPFAPRLHRRIARAARRRRGVPPRCRGLAHRQTGSGAGPIS